MSQQGPSNPAPRRRKAQISIWGITQLHLRDPFVVAFWSAIFPGSGHMLLGKYIRGFTLFIWEVVINLRSRLNLGILYTFLGRFEEAKQAVDTRWLLLYIPTYLFAFWDSYRICVDLNHQYVLAAREDAPVEVQVIHPLGLNCLDRISPWSAFMWSTIFPGAGQLIQRNTIIAFF